MFKDTKNRWKIFFCRIDLQKFLEDQMLEILNEGKEKVLYGQPDNGSLENYTFSLKDGKWFLIKVELPSW